ncbi:hypothetical protein HMPREF2533_00596 [Bacteroides fragilis]|nr:hypothetical protein HMPREF2530_00596 [Bacteroides fragilis]KXU50001.1 hypothetical protein HMPREF2533_00596 [Bacteroides fragilis]
MHKGFPDSFITTCLVLNGLTTDYTDSHRTFNLIIDKVNH